MGVKDSIEFKGIVMRSVPDNVRENFKRLALEEFDNHYGLTLRAILFDYFEYQKVKEMFFTGQLDLNSLKSKDENTSPIGLGGEPIKLRRNK